LQAARISPGRFIFSMNIYETERLLHEYLLFHFATPEEILPWPDGPHSALNFPVRTVHDLLSQDTLPAQSTALDLGCAVGRSSFELTAFCDQVIGIDFSQSFIDAAAQLAQTRSLPYRRHEEASRYTDALATVPAHLRTQSAHFEQGDAMHLRSDLGSFDVVHAANLLCRLPDPLLCLQRLPDLVNPGGQLLLTTPCTWLEEFTPRDAWPANGSTFDWLEHHLSPHFTLEQRLDMPFLIREHARKFQWSVALGTRWRRHT
jgi:putative 4-mercaptohistidine N1-methyltranferase